MVFFRLSIIFLTLNVEIRNRDGGVDGLFTTYTMEVESLFEYGFGAGGEGMVFECFGTWRGCVRVKRALDLV